MSQTNDASGGSVAGDARQGSTGSRGAAATAKRYLDRIGPKRAAAGVGGLFVLRGLRGLRSGSPLRGLVRLAVGGSLIAVARRRSGSGGVDESDVVNTSPDVEDVSSGVDPGDREHAGGDAAEEVVGTGPDVEDVSSGLDSEDQGTDAAEEFSEAGSNVENAVDDESGSDDESESVRDDESEPSE
ncbi:hypothetical protein [Halomicrobium urmianum]|uniref:hypothetical protein n=1 Tax=Halomicrobium urmianum TaxID=1586233 RepID=UPI001CDA2BF1|nr:hypothetical protein [Halomicrobium urmianum]